MSDLSELHFFCTPAHPCSYLEGEQATTLFMDPGVIPGTTLYSQLSRQGFRRSGEYLYRPHCDHCQACIAARVRVADFHLHRRHRRILSRNRDLLVSDEPARYTREVYRLYARYINDRHADGDMYPPSEEQFTAFLISDWAETRFHCFRSPQGKLLAVAVTDQLDDGLSAVYTFFDPEHQARSLGVQAILWQIDAFQQQERPYLYLGYWIRQCQKMSYKSQYQPLEVFRQGRWCELDQP